MEEYVCAHHATVTVHPPCLQGAHFQWGRSKCAHTLRSHTLHCAHTLHSYLGVRLSDKTTHYCLQGAHVKSCLLTFNPGCSRSILFAHVKSWSLTFNPVCSRSILFAHVQSCLLTFITIYRVLTFNEAEAVQELEACLQDGDADRGYKQLEACMGERGCLLPCRR